MRFVITLRRFIFDFTITAIQLLVTASHGTICYVRFMFCTITVGGRIFLTFTVSLLVVTFVIRVATTVVIVTLFFLPLSRFTDFVSDKLV